MSQPIRVRGGHFVFPIGPKNTNFVEDVDIVLPVKFRRITRTWQRPTLKFCFLSSFVEFCSAVTEEKSKMSQPIRGQGGLFEILLPVKFR